MSNPENKTPLLEMLGISKQFPGVRALEGVSLSVGHSEVVGLIGENGAGKSTLMKILGGIYRPDTGEIHIDGQYVRIPNVAASIALGIAFIHQELNVLDNLDVASNVFLGREPVYSPLRLINRRKLHDDTTPLLKRLGMNVSSRAPLRELPIAQRQMVEIAKALSLNARLIIMDEPTSSLTLKETNRLLELVRELRAQGVSIIYISHRLTELDSIADRVVGLRDGRNAGELSRAQINHDAMVRMMVGRDIKSFYQHSQATVTPAWFRVRNVRTPVYPQHKVSFDAGRGEILGIAGLVGAGRSELAEAIFGARQMSGGSYFLGGEELYIDSVRGAIRHGIYLAPEDRRGKGLITQMRIRENIALPAQSHYARFGMIQRWREKAVAEREKEQLKIKAPSVESLVYNLSGGNQQKVVLGRWLSLKPRVIIFDEPTRGIDVGAKSEIYQIMRELARAGVVIIMISSDMEEIINVSDRVAVMHEGRIAGTLERADCTEENIMQLAVGGKVACAKPAFAVSNSVNSEQ